MYEVRKRIEISAAHRLKLSYGSKCENLHGQNWIIDVFLRAKTLNEDGIFLFTIPYDKGRYGNGFYPYQASGSG